MSEETVVAQEHLDPEADPRLHFGEGFDIAEGVVVQPIDYPPGLSHPPFKSTVFVVEPGRSSPLDQHEVAETWLILNGTGVLDYEGAKVRVSRLDKLFFPSLKRHQIMNDAAAPLEILSVYWPVK